MDGLRIARVEFIITNEYYNGNFDTVLIESINRAVPNLILEAFKRHIWVSQHCLSQIFVFEILVKEKNTYAICIIGFASDGYDNAYCFLEIFDELEKFLIAVSIGEGEITWLDRCIDGDDFVISAPKWAGDFNLVGSLGKIWSEATAIRVEKEGNITRLIMY